MILSQEAVSLCAALKGNIHLTELYASNHEMSAQTAAVVSDLLATTSTLKMLCLGDAAFGDAGLVALAPGLQANQSLTRLDLEGKVNGFLLCFPRLCISRTLHKNAAIAKM